MPGNFPSAHLGVHLSLLAPPCRVGGGAILRKRGKGEKAAEAQGGARKCRAGFLLSSTEEEGCEAALLLPRFLEARSLHLTPQFLQCRGRKQGASDVGN